MVVECIQCNSLFFLGLDSGSNLLGFSTDVDFDFWPELRPIFWPEVRPIFLAGILADILAGLIFWPEFRPSFWPEFLPPSQE